jgi:hypothetical protein
MRAIIHPSEREIASPAPSQGLEGAFVEIVSRGSGVDVSASHGLRRVPYGAFPVSHTGEVLYDPAGATNPVRLKPWTVDEVWFQPATPAGTRHRFLVF